MKKFLALLLIMTLVTAMLPGIAGAEGEEVPVVTPEATVPEEGTESEAGEEPGLLPDSPFYFLKRLVEDVKVFFTFDDEDKTDLLAELVDLRALELDTLEQKYAGQELSSKQQKVMNRAAKQLEKSAGRLVDRLLGPDENLENLELTEKQIGKLEKAMERMGKALEKMVQAENKGEEAGEQLKAEYQERITKLEQIRNKNPEAQGLTRAIENAYKQQARWADKEIEEGTDKSNKDNGHNEDNNDNKPEENNSNADKGEDNSNKANNSKDKEGSSGKGN